VKNYDLSFWYKYFGDILKNKFKSNFIFNLRKGKQNIL